MKNKYFSRSRISERKFREIIKLFSADLTASQIARLSKVSRPTINKILQEIRKRMVAFCEKESCFERGQVEMDESYFGPRRIRGKRGRGAYGKTIVFGLKKRDGRVYTQIIKNCSKTEILPLIKTKIKPDVILFTDGFKTYDSLVDLGYKKHYRVHHGKNEFAKKQGRIKNHINGIENFWAEAKLRMSKFKGIDKNFFYLHLKECEFRFNHRHENLYLLLLKIIKKDPLNLS